MLSVPLLVLAAAAGVPRGAATTPTVGLALEKTTQEATAVVQEQVRATLATLSKTLNFQTRQLYVSPPLSHQHQPTQGLVGVVVAAERCGGYDGLAGVDIPVLSLMLDVCDDQTPEPTAIPLYTLTARVSSSAESRREDCLPMVLRLWVERVLSGVEDSGKRSSSGSDPLPPPPVRSNTTFLPLLLRQRLAHAFPINYLEEMRKCLKESPSAGLVLGGGSSYREMLRTRTKALLQGHVVSIVLKHRTPYVFLQLEGRTVLGSDGILIQLLRSLAHIYNFTYTMKLPDDGQWGSILADGSWNGMVGEVYRNEVEMALGPTSITEEREKAIDFTVPFDFEPWDIMIPASQENIDLAAFMIPFSGEVWVGLLTSWVVVGVLLYFLARATAALPNTTDSSLSMVKVLLDTFGSLISQCAWQPKTAAMRVLAGWWWLFCVIAITSYSSKLIASITVRLTAPAVTSLLQMVEEESIIWTYQANSAMEELFKYSEPNSLFGKVAQLHRRREGLLVYSFNEGVDAVRDKEYAYIEDASLLEYAIADDLAVHGSCRMSLVRDHFFSTRFGMILQRGSPYREAFSMEILYFIQTGLMDAWKKEFWPAASRCVGAATKRPVRALNFLDIAGTLLLLQAGLTISALIFLLEFACVRRLPKCCY
ncbi:glutamate receptor U1-like [Panulirus ornatus]|uniref:glutamate receptor U1-like n=1 Tax=Panulirus ornatus TaxID=150431 RepID=UPI003A84014D